MGTTHKTLKVLLFLIFVIINSCKATIAQIPSSTPLQNPSIKCDTCSETLSPPPPPPIVECPPPPPPPVIECPPPPPPPCDDPIPPPPPPEEPPCDPCMHQPPPPQPPTFSYNSPAKSLYPIEYIYSKGARIEGTICAMLVFIIGAFTLA
ncbi:unnamed protein product [Amaranthus hypochondriacus]